MTAPTRPPSIYVGGSFESIPGDGLVSVNPAQPEEVLWSGSPEPAHVEIAVAAAREAQPAWAALSPDDRFEALRGWQAVVADAAEDLAVLISDEMGKVLAEARGEATLLAARLDTLRGGGGVARVTDWEQDLSDTRRGACRFRAHGVLAILGPFNFPAHLPAGQFLPALLAGNTVVFKPSERTPAVGQRLAEGMHAAGLPPGVFNMIHGGSDVGSTLTDHDDIDGILFTGSWPTGRRILEQNLDRPGRLIALEMGGSSPAVVLADAPMKRAVLECARGAFATTGQRCSCTRRIILHEPIADRFLKAFLETASALSWGDPRGDAPVFMGPSADPAAVDRVLSGQVAYAAGAGHILLEATAPDQPGWYVTPGVVAVEGYPPDLDEEIFGPLVRVSRAATLDDAIEQANATRYGLVASLFSTDDDAFATFRDRVRAGCLHRNTGTAGASGALPFGGLGISGNHRPAGAFVGDACAHPVAIMDESDPDASVSPGMAWEDGWLA